MNQEKDICEICRSKMKFIHEQKVKCSSCEREWQSWDHQTDKVFGHCANWEWNYENCTCDKIEPIKIYACSNCSDRKTKETNEKVNNICDICGENMDRKETTKRCGNCEYNDHHDMRPYNMTRKRDKEDQCYCLELKEKIVYYQCSICDKYKENKYTSYRIKFGKYSKSSSYYYGGRGGSYKCGEFLSVLVYKDLKYCEWLSTQEWFDQRDYLIYLIKCHKIKNKNIQ